MNLNDLCGQKWGVHMVPIDPGIVPDGWEATGELRIARRGETISLMEPGGKPTALTLYNLKSNVPTLILRRKQPRRWEECTEAEYNATDRDKRAMIVPAYGIQPGRYSREITPEKPL